MFGRKTFILPGFEFLSQDLSQANEHGPEKDRPDRPDRPKTGEMRVRVTIFPSSSLCGHESGDENGKIGRYNK
jgi:hypothetical protein